VAEQTERRIRAAGVFAFPGLWLHPDIRFCALRAFVVVRVDRRLALNGLDEAQRGWRHRGLRYWAPHRSAGALAGQRQEHNPGMTEFSGWAGVAQTVLDVIKRFT
jgi:hypothetical protein